jgi:hypothetical protein
MNDRGLLSGRDRVTQSWPAKKHSQPLIKRVSEPLHSSELHWLTAERDSRFYPYRGWECGDLYLHSPIHFNSMMLKAGKPYVILKQRAVSTVKATRELLYTELRLWALLAIIRMISGNHTRSIYRNNVVTFNACYCNCIGPRLFNNFLQRPQHILLTPATFVFLLMRRPSLSYKNFWTVPVNLTIFWPFALCTSHFGNISDAPNFPQSFRDSAHLSCVSKV